MEDYDLESELSKVVADRRLQIKDRDSGYGNLHERIAMVKSEAVKHFLNYFETEILPQLPTGYSIINSNAVIRYSNGKITMISGTLRRRWQAEEDEDKELNEEELFELLDRYASETAWIKDVNKPFIVHY